MANIGATYKVELENEVVRLYEVDGLSIAKIVSATGVRERRVKQLVSGKIKGSGVPTNLNKASAAVYQHAISSCGISNDEVRTICHGIYGVTWNPSTGKYDSNLTQTDIDKVKRKVRDLAVANSEVATFRPSWMNPLHATDCWKWMESFALEMRARYEEGMNEFMERFAVPVVDSVEGDLLRKKQYYSGMRHISSLSTGLGSEPVETLLSRTKGIADRIDGREDLPAPARPQGKLRQLIPEPKRECYDPFFDEIERMELALQLAA
ncbi:hypothetical protein PPUJ20028_49990 [Pseudomonas putida]|uniref:Uncharacterized protein n=1 Tax=Pseudomonas putida TaxID=303 RepID=A0AA37RFM8_PSEPU|nr:hypothetical protein [Pseudomonas putida]GLO16413.1 hypothetical protein PPUJ20028_49990 [Pseudomonas putida]GLO38215.1 hypothetical protein PPUN14671_50520 [Pseudomonas putida]HDS0966892.1 hypothetical protein [Pseudomonas putida]HDS0993343.1 hypothetical protein [Pseudomonas putida]